MLANARLRLVPRFDPLFGQVRLKLVLWNLGIFFLLLTAVSMGVYLYFSHQLYNGVDSDLQSQSDHVISVLESEPQLYGFSPAGLLLQRNDIVLPPYRIVGFDALQTVRVSPECFQYPASFPLGNNQPFHCDNRATSQGGVSAVFNASPTSCVAPPSGNPQVLYCSDLRTSTFRGAPWRVLTIAVSINGRVTGGYQIARDISGEQDSLRELGWLLFLGLFGGLLLAGVASLFLASKALVPIRQAFQRQRQFTADASHELRTPLALIRANAEMLYRHSDRLPLSDSDLIGEIIGETDHVSRLVGDLLTLARADADALKLATQPVDFRALVANVHEDLSRIAESRGIETSLSLNGPVTVPGDEGRLRQLLLILLDNALKYTDAGGRVAVSLGREDNRARLIVADSGIGIPADDLPHIFKRFYRVDRAREHESGGTGLGLAIADWIARAHHGQIRVESTLGEGSTFRVDLPTIASPRALEDLQMPTANLPR